MSDEMPTWLGDAQRRTWEVAKDLVEKSDSGPEQMAELLDPEVGQTESEVIYEENKLELHHYEPDEVTQETPIFFVYSLVNRPYIVDLQPQTSVLRRLLEGGYELYLIDWGEPSTLDRSLTLSDYVHRYMENCIDAACDHSGVDEVNLAGYCMGGNLSIMYTTYDQERVRTLMLMATPLAFEGDGGILERWANHYNADAAVETYGNMPWRLLTYEFTMMDPVRQYITKYVTLYDNLEDDAFVEQFARMEKWSWDGVDLAGETYREFVKEVYQQNKMIESEFESGGERVNLSEIDVPLLQLVGEYDHIVPPETSKPLNDEVSSEDETIIEAPTGHIGLSVSGYSHAELWPTVVEWFTAREPGGEMDPDATVEESEPAEESSPDDETATADDSTETVPATNGEAASVEELSGIGPTYAERLDDAGIETASDLAQYGPEELAEIADTYPSRTEDWLEQVV